MMAILSIFHMEASNVKQKPGKICVLRDGLNTVVKVY